MSAIHGHLRMQLRDEFDDGRLVWVLLDPVSYESDVLGRVVTVPAGFVTDLESVPVRLAGWAGPPMPRAGLVHDWLYQSHECERHVADLVYEEFLKVCGLADEYVAQRYAAVSAYGARAYATGPARLRVEAPAPALSA